MQKLIIAAIMLLFACPSVSAQPNPVLITPVYKAELPQEVRETSGLFYHNGRIWTHNDSGGKPILYALDSATMKVVQRITLNHARNKDWEDVCTDGETVFVGDIGNNKGKRKNLKIYTFPLSALPEEGDANIDVDSIQFRFADQTNFEKRKVHDFDCEAICVTEDFIYLFSKGWATGTTKLYRLPKTPGKYVAEVVNSFNSRGLVTGADYDRESHTLVLVGYVNKEWTPFVYLIYDFEEHGEQLSFQRFELPNYWFLQMEGVTFMEDGHCYISAESNKMYTARIFELDFKKWIDENQKNLPKLTDE